MFNCNDLEELLEVYLNDANECKSMSVRSIEVQDDIVYYQYTDGYYCEWHDSETGHTELILWYINNKDKV